MIDFLFEVWFSFVMFTVNLNWKYVEVLDFSNAIKLFVHPT